MSLDLFGGRDHAGARHDQAAVKRCWAFDRLATESSPQSVMVATGSRLLRPRRYSLRVASGHTLKLSSPDLGFPPIARCRPARRRLTGSWLLLMTALEGSEDSLLTTARCKSKAAPPSRPAATAAAVPAPKCESEHLSAATLAASGAPANGAAIEAMGARAQESASTGPTAAGEITGLDSAGGCFSSGRR
ncbi:hypothetical protein PHYPSEUDO_007753 [Phytophthora pseudosyringae]|uniref:Uncharacterized protein n=1 Tax=Phytophthora pseudosyringae TaxID=221518 RepID=A0A8T1VL69_9STRA|nr:hypothetical protein PHYPSEUDO_007753 [Phytophthora pseudosyringae]